LTDAEVELELWTGNDWSWQDQTSTDGNGSYQFDGLPAGTYRIKFEDESGEYALEYYNNEVEFDLAENIVLAPEQQLENINASLVPGSRINGKVTGPDGSPLAAVWVDVFRLQENGQWDWYEDTEANADGTYEIGGLPNGTYRVGFLDDDEVHAVQFYENNGNTMYFELAQNLVISSPQTISGANAKFDKKAGTIEGKVTGSDGSTPLHEVRIEAYRKDDEGAWLLVLFGDVGSDDDGFFDPGMLPAGTYRFKFQKDGYLTKFYGNVATLADAKDIVLGDGQVVEGINVSLSTEPAPQSIGDWTSGYTLSGGDALASADPDKDGLNNALEYVLGGDPIKNDAANLAPSGVKSGSNFIFSFKRSLAAKSDPNTTLAVEYGSNMKVWGSYPIGTDSSGSVVITSYDSASDSVVVTIPTANAAQFFARLKVTVTDSVSP
jgi:5-hydroxyisourate hydrolase-like protein (transthyretin family)